MKTMTATHPIERMIIAAIVTLEAVACLANLAIDLAKGISILTPEIETKLATAAEHAPAAEQSKTAPKASATKHATVAQLRKQARTAGHKKTEFMRKHELLALLT